ncbi:hypothetical protein ABFX02_07G018400 [Erythranthe guttata]
MGCLPCFGRGRRSGVNEESTNDSRGESSSAAQSSSNRVNSEAATPQGANANSKVFTFSELCEATNNFRPEGKIGEGGFGCVYKGHLPRTGQVVAVKRLNHSGMQGNQEFVVEVSMLTLLNDPNLINFIGYCADGDERILVYEYMPLGSLDAHLHDLQPDKQPLDWNTRMKIADGTARGLEYLHDRADLAVIFRDLKPSNILLGDGYVPKLSDFGLAKLGPVGDKSYVTTRVMGTHGYCAPEYALTGQLTSKSDIYTFGVVLLEIITGRKAFDRTRRGNDRVLVEWARPLFADERNFPNMADPLLQGRYPMRGLRQALGVAAMCLQEREIERPKIGEIVTATTFITSLTYEPNAPPPPAPTQDNNNQAGGSTSMPRLQDLLRVAAEVGEGSGSHQGSSSTHTREYSPSNLDMEREPAVAAPAPKERGDGAESSE